MDGTDPGVLVAVFKTNHRGFDVANSQAVHVFDLEDIEQIDKPIREFVRSHLEDKYGMVKKLRTHRKLIHTVAGTDQ